MKLLLFDVQEQLTTISMQIPWRLSTLSAVQLYARSSQSPRGDERIGYDEQKD